MLLTHKISNIVFLIVYLVGKSDIFNMLTLKISLVHIFFLFFFE